MQPRNVRFAATVKAADSREGVLKANTIPTNFKPREKKYGTPYHQKLDHIKPNSTAGEYINDEINKGICCLVENGFLKLKSIVNTFSMGRMVSEDELKQVKDLLKGKDLKYVIEEFKDILEDRMIRIKGGDIGRCIVLHNALTELDKEYEKVVNELILHEQTILPTLSRSEDIAGAIERNVGAKTDFLFERVHSASSAIVERAKKNIAEYEKNPGKPTSTIKAIIPNLKENVKNPATIRFLTNFHLASTVGTELTTSSTTALPDFKQLNRNANPRSSSLNLNLTERNTASSSQSLASIREEYTRISLTSNQRYTSPNRLPTIKPKQISPKETTLTPEEEKLRNDFTAKYQMMPKDTSERKKFFDTYNSFPVVVRQEVVKHYEQNQFKTLKR